MTELSTEQKGEWARVADGAVGLDCTS